MKITLIGAGNVGYHLGKRLFKKGITVRQVYSRQLKNAQFLTKKINATPIHELSAVDAKSDLYIIAVKDDAIETVTKALSEQKGMKHKLVVHTSGAASSELIAKYFSKFGIFYPLQSFSKARKIRFSNIPICVYAGKSKDLKKLSDLANLISNKVATINDKERAILHVAAVIVNNFTNHLFHLGQQITKKEQLDFDLLKPLIKETVLKISKHPPLEMQTGPARRNDEKTIKKHLKYLKKFPKYPHLYTLLTKSIQDAHRR